jgi:hypothetical protein
MIDVMDYESKISLGQFSAQLDRTIREGGEISPAEPKQLIKGCTQGVANAILGALRSRQSSTPKVQTGFLTSKEVFRRYSS